MGRVIASMQGQVGGKLRAPGGGVAGSASFEALHPRVKGKFVRKPTIAVPRMQGTGGHARGSVEYHAARVALHAARARAHAHNFRATGDKSHALAAATSARFARGDAARVARMTGRRGEHHEAAQRHLSEAEQHHASVSGQQPRAIAPPPLPMMRDPQNRVAFIPVTPPSSPLAIPRGGYDTTPRPAAPMTPRPAARARGGQIKSASHGLTRVKHNVDQANKHLEKATAIRAEMRRRGEAGGDAERDAKKHELAAAASLKRAEGFHAQLQAMTGGVGEHHQRATDAIGSLRARLGHAPAVRAPTAKPVVGGDQHEQQRRALAAIDAEKAKPNATTYHSNFRDPMGIATPMQKRSFEEGLSRRLGRPITLEEVTHGFAVPDGFEARLRSLNLTPPTISFDIYHTATGKRAADLSRDFPSGGGVHHAFFKVDPQFQGSALSDHVNGNAMRHYEKWGVKHVEVNAAWVGRYAWARMGFHFDDTHNIERQFASFVDKHPALASRRAELTATMRQLVKEPWKLAKWGIGQKFPNEYGKDNPRKDASGNSLPNPDEHLGKAFLLSRNVSMWDGRIKISRDNPGYLHAITKVAVVREGA